MKFTVRRRDEPQIAQSNQIHMLHERENGERVKENNYCLEERRDEHRLYIFGQIFYL